MKKYTKSEIEETARSNGSNYLGDILNYVLQYIPEDPNHPTEVGIYWAQSGIDGRGMIVSLKENKGPNKVDSNVLYILRIIWRSDDLMETGLWDDVDAFSISRWGPKISTEWAENIERQPMDNPLEEDVSEEEELTETVAYNPDLVKKYMNKEHGNTMMEFIMKAEGCSVFNKETCVTFTLVDVSYHKTFGLLVINGLVFPGNAVNYMVDPEELYEKFEIVKT
jgi:hypothetical protein